MVKKVSKKHAQITKISNFARLKSAGIIPMANAGVKYFHCLTCDKKLNVFNTAHANNHLETNSHKMNIKMNLMITQLA